MSNNNILSYILNILFYLHTTRCTHDTELDILRHMHMFSYVVSFVAAVYCATHM